MPKDNNMDFGKLDRLEHEMEAMQQHIRDLHDRIDLISQVMRENNQILLDKIAALQWDIHEQ